MLTVEARVLGRREPLVPAHSLSLPAAPAEPLALRELIERVVREEVRAFRDRQERGQLIQVLTEAEIEAGAARGRVEMGGRDPGPGVDEEAAVTTAVQAFRDGLFLVLVDDEEQNDLDAPVPLRETSRLTFLRLTLLAGG